MDLLLVSGGTGGHIAPALSVLDRAIEMGVGVDLILGGLKVRMGVNRAKYVYSAGEINLKNFGKIVGGIFQTFGDVWRSKVILAFGGYPVFPPLFNAVLLRKKFYLFEGDAMPGRANRFFEPFAVEVLCAFRNSVRFYRRGVFVGIPIRKDLTPIPREVARERMGISTDLPVVGIMGGSQGSQFLNTLARSLADTRRYYVVALVGRRGEAEEGPNHRFIPFLSDMSSFYSSLDAIISRAGMSSIGEIAYFRVPPLFIPYPYAGGHQIHNALDVVNFGAGEMLLQEEASLERVEEKLRVLITRQNIYRNRLGHYFVPGAAERIVDRVLLSVG